MSTLRLSRPLAFANIGLVVGSFLLFAWRLPHLPDRVPLQFGASGAPSRWGSPHELWVVGGVMVLLSTLFGVIGWLVASMPGPAPAQHVEQWRALTQERSVRSLRVMEWMMLSMNAGLAILWAILSTGRPELAPIGIAAVLLLSTVGVVAALVPHGSRLAQIGEELRALGVSGASAQGYRWGGLVYYAPDDPAVFVPKRLGFGLTVNFARRQAWLITAAALVIPLAGAAFAIVSICRM